MKKIFTIVASAALMLVATSALAQSQIAAGFVRSTDSFKASADANASTEVLNGFYAGVGYSIPLAAGIKVTPGIYYSVLMGSDAESFGSFASLKGDKQEHYLNVPVTLSLGANLAPDIRLFAYAGPTLSVGLISQTKVTTSILGFSKDSVVDHYASDSGYGRFDVLVGGGAGVELMKRFRVNVGYDFGLLNRYTGSGNGIEHRNQLVAGVALVF